MKHKITLKFQKKAILKKNYIKYLGVMIDSTLTWHTQIENIFKKISRGIGLLYKIRPFVNMKIMKTLYYSLIYPHLLYAIEVWGSADTSALNSLLVLQKRIVRLLSNSDTRLSDYSFPPPTPLFFREKLLKVQDIFKIRIAKFIYNSLNKTSPANFHLWFKLTTQVHNHHTKSQYIDIENSILTNNLFIPTARTSHYVLKLIKIQRPKIWNDIRPSIRNITVSNIFLTKLKKSILESYNIQVLGD